MIELTVAIVLVGALGATAGAFGSAIGMAHVACIVSDYAGQDNLPIFGTGNVDFNANCYPSSTNGRNGNVNANRCRQIWLGILTLAPSISRGATGTTDYRAQARGGGTLCRYTYRNDTVTTRSFDYSPVTGAIVVTNL